MMLSVAPITGDQIVIAPLVSVCIAVYNCERFIKAAIQSVLTQTFQDFEVVVVDNASTDGTLAAVQAVSDRRIRVFCNATNIGSCLNWNRAIEESRGRYVKLLGADDILYPDCLAEQIAAFEAPGGDTVALACFPRDVIDSEGTVLVRSHGWRTRGGYKRIPGRTAIRIMARQGRNLIGEPVTTLYRRQDAVDLGYFSPAIEARFPFCLDWDLWCRLLQRGDLHVGGASLGAFRVNAGSNSLNLVGKFAANDRDYIAYLREQQLADITYSDYCLGAARAWRDALLRRVFYLYLRIRRTLRIEKA